MEGSLLAILESLKGSNWEVYAPYLNDPKGLAYCGGSLYVADVDRIRQRFSFWLDPRTFPQSSKLAILMGTPSLRLIFPEKPLYNNLYGAWQDLEVGSDDISGGDGIMSIKGNIRYCLRI
jgi:hypothetical protein